MKMWLWNFLRGLKIEKMVKNQALVNYKKINALKIAF